MECRKSVVGVQFCSCEMEAVTLIRYNLWPATPTSPKLAFDFKLMELCTVLQLECQMPTKSFNCSNFKAGNALRSNQTNSKLDITGLFGSICKHDVPLQFLNMDRGESLAYSSFLAMEFSSLSSEQIVISYDIACSLEKHLKKNNNDLLERIILTVPVFHSFAHNLTCQLNFGQRFVKETGLVDGEGIERFWSFLRQDLLTEAMFHYSEKAALKLDGQRTWKRISKQLANNTTLLNKRIKQLAPFRKIEFNDVIDIHSNLFHTDLYCEITKE
ncbi:uncharacterized protein LOC126824362 [Patella vulgata]|uniref:uncharacterized protein LOC126824362 n=1 Tax=Patella vulgata TaxID=6465 RepID=UPI0021800C69|nr:uncharacterized protein LOC126824362 [Patella vulgata]